MLALALVSAVVILQDSPTAAAAASGARRYQVDLHQQTDLQPEHGGAPITGTRRVRAVLRVEPIAADSHEVFVVVEQMTSEATGAAQQLYQQLGGRDTTGIVLSVTVRNNKVVGPIEATYQNVATTPLHQVVVLMYPGILDSVPGRERTDSTPYDSILPRYTKHGMHVEARLTTEAHAQHLTARTRSSGAYQFVGADRRVISARTYSGDGQLVASRASVLQSATFSIAAESNDPGNGITTTHWSITIRRID